MNVLFVVPWDNIGGVSHVVNRVAQHMRDRGDGVYFLLPGSPAHPERTVSLAGFPAFRMYTRPTRIPTYSLRSRIAFALTLPLTLVRLARLLRQLRIDVVNVHFPGSPNVYFALLRRMGLVRLVTSIHGADMLPNGSRELSQHGPVLSLLAASDTVVAPSESYHRAVQAAWPELDAPTCAIPNGIDPDELGYRPGVDETEEPPFVLSIAHLVHYKGVDVLIRAFAALAEDYPRLVLRLASDGPQRAEFEALAASLGVSHRVQFLGVLQRDAVGAMLRRCTFFVLPSRTNSESFGIAAAEAMAVDRPVIASRIGGLPELIEDGMSGLLVPPGDVAALERAMRTLLDDAELRRGLARAGGERVRRHFLWDRTCTLYEQLFDELVPLPLPGPVPLPDSTRSEPRAGVTARQADTGGAVAGPVPHMPQRPSRQLAASPAVASQERHT
jgi:glycosyltransferase involved in cell wall biosynthesis